MNNAKCTNITPMVWVADFQKSLNFYKTILGFEVGAELEGYAYMVRDSIAIRLLAKQEASEHAEQSCYICVNGLDKLYQELKPKLDELPDSRVKPPLDQPYGQREFHVTDEDGLLLFFGEKI